jgi:uncharacterized membrane protein
VGFSGMSVGLVVLVLLVVGLIYALAVAMLAAAGRRIPEMPAWTTYLIPLLCAAGLGVAGYLAFIETRHVAAICGPLGDCNTVQSSPYAKLFGVLPVGLLGFFGYLAILCAWALMRFGRGRLSELGGLVVFALALFGVLFSIYLTYLELAVIRAVCMWCLTSAVLMAVLLVLSSSPVANWLARQQESYT